MFTSGNIIK